MVHVWRLFTRDQRLIPGTDNGERDVHAATTLFDDGFSNVCAMSQGIAGWTRYNLPTVADNRPGVATSHC